jgi:ribose transport system permease protein
MSKGKRLACTAAIPLLVCVITNLICMAKGVAMFESSLHVLTLIRAVANVILVTYALSINLNSGRFDFSVGSIALLSSVLSSTITLKYGLGPVPMLALSLLFGLLLGLLSGFVYITLKLPPMIISLGVALFYEGLAYSITDGHGISFINNKELLGFGTIPSYLIIIVCALIFMVILFDQTTFGYDYKALLSGQRVAVNTGIKEKKNALICYGAAGLLMGAQGFISATTTGSIQMSLNFGSIGIMFTAFLPMFIGGYIGRFSNDKLGYLLGAVSMAFISLTYVRLMVNSSVQQVVSALLLVGFLIYLNNEQRILSLFRKTH